MRHLMSCFCMIIIAYLGAMFAFSLVKLIGQAGEDNLLSGILNTVDVDEH